MNAKRSFSFCQDILGIIVFVLQLVDVGPHVLQLDSNWPLFAERLQRFL